MNVTFFIGGLSGGGAERVVCNLAKYLSDKGDICTVLTMSEDKDVYGLKETIKTQSLLLDSERRNPVLDNLKRIRRLHTYIRRNNCDSYVVFLPITTILFLIFRNFTKARVIVSERSDPNRYSKWKQILLKKLAKRADVWVFQTEDSKAWYGNTVKDAIVIPNAINKAFLVRSLSEEKQKVIVGVGRLSAEKNFSMLVEAFSDIADEFPDYRLDIYGEGEQRNLLEQLTKELNISDRVKFPGYLSSLEEKIQSASLFVLSSNFEGMPNALLEAMALGLPCISTDCPVGGPRSLICNGENGILVPVGDKQSLSNTMRNILQNPEFATKLGRNAKEVRERFHPDIIYPRWADVIAGRLHSDGR